MMRLKISAFFLLFAQVTVFANNLDVGGEYADYHIVKSEKTVLLRLGTTRVKGKVMNKNGEPLAYALVSALNDSVAVYADEFGEYELLITEKDTSIYVYMPKYEEVAIDHYDFKSQEEVTINFYLKALSVISIGTSISPVRARALKPVIYLYSFQQLEASVSVNFKGDLTFMYPNYNNEWRVTVDEQGMREKESEKRLPYLFWEGETTGLTYNKKDGMLLGTTIKTDTLVSFFENQLSNLGLTRTEQTDFITFWAPRVMDTPFAFVQFLVDDEYDKKLGELQVSPAPDYQRRIYLLYTPLKTATKLKSIPQKFKKSERFGFSVVEWGGSQIGLSYEG